MPEFIDSNINLTFIQYLKRIWIHRNLISIFAWKNVKGKIAQTRFGILLILFQSIILALIFSFFIGRFVDFNVSYPYLLFAVSGMMIWYVFSYLAVLSGMSIIQNQSMISRIYFPRILLPLSFSLFSVIDYIGWLLVIIILMIYYGYLPGINSLAIILFMLINIISGLTVGIWISLFSLKKRDISLIAPLILGLGLFLTPVFYPVHVLPDSLVGLLYLNPLAGAVEGVRWALFDTGFDVHYLWGFLLVIILFMTGIFVFSKKDGNIADAL